MYQQMSQSIYQQNWQTQYQGNVTSTISANYGGKKMKYKTDCFILHAVLSVIILLLIIAFICYHYTKHISK